MREVTCPSSAILKIMPAPFGASKALYQSVLKEMRAVSISGSGEIAEAVKNFFCAGFSSAEVEKCLKECFKQCIYNYGKGDLKIDDSSFEPVENREDYMTVCIEVAKENINPFLKSLYAEYRQAISMLVNIQA